MVAGNVSYLCDVADIRQQRGRVRLDYEIYKQRQKLISALGFLKPTCREENILINEMSD